MRWLVEIVDVVADERLFADVLAGLDTFLYQEDNRTYLVSNKFDLLSASSEVWELAGRVRDVVSEVSEIFPDANISFDLSNVVYEQKDDGSRRRTHYVPAGSMFAIGLSIAFEVTEAIVLQKDTSEEERARLDAEHKERQYQEKLNRVRYRLLPVFHDERALKVHHLLQQELTPGVMYKIHELIQDDLGEKLNSLASHNQWKRFTRSVNHQAVFGDAARHATLKAEPPANPMTLSEAQDFIRKVADLWFKQKYAGYTATIPHP